MTRRTATNACVRWYAFAGGVFGFSLSYSLLLIWSSEFHPGWLFDLFWDAIRTPNRPRWRRGPPAISELVDTLERMTEHGLIGFGTAWGLIHGTYLGLADEISRQAKTGQGDSAQLSKKQSLVVHVGLASAVLIVLFALWTFFSNNEYSCWVFLDAPFAVGVHWRYGTNVDSPYWSHFFYRPYFAGLGCLAFSSIGLTLARRMWLRMLFLLPTSLIFYWLSWNPYFPLKLWGPFLRME